VVKFGSTLILFAALVAFAGPRAAESSEETFLRGNDAYENQQFDLAAEAYESLVRYQISDPRLEYNLANVEFRRGNLGRSILHYQRAHRLDPTDEDIKANLDFVASHTVDQIPEAEAAAVILWIRGIQDQLGPDSQAWLVLVLVWLICSLIAWGLIRSRGWTPTFGWAVAVLIVAVTLSTGSWWVTYERLEGREIGVVLEPTVEVLGGPGLNYLTLFTVHEGLSVRIRSDERGGWIQVSLPNGLTGWIPISTIGIV
jgi:hypothetical protein